MNSIPTPNDLAREALETLQNAPPESPREHLSRLERLGLIDTHGRVTKLFGGEAEPEIEKADAYLANGSNSNK
jgi:hypothetical protein